MAENSGIKKYIPKQVENFLKTEEGKRFFAEISDCETRQQKYDRVQTFLRVPNNVRLWLDRLEMCKKRVEK